MPLKTLCLNGDWRLTDAAHNAGADEGLHRPETDASAWLTVPVPGDIHPALEAQGRLPDPFWELNSDRCTWTGRRDWWHRRDFEVPADFAGDRIDLVFDGIDTYVEV